MRMPIIRALGLFCLASASVARADVTLVDNGKPAATIVIAKEALGAAPDPTLDKIWWEQPGPNKIAAAARDLQLYIEKMSGAKLPLVSDETEPAGALVLVGRSKLTAKYDKLIPAGLTPGRREEGLLIHNDGNRLLLAGNDAGPYHGTEYAVSEFLERQGVRWYMPGEFGEVVPRLATIRFTGGDVKQSPDFICRNWWGPRDPEMGVPEYRWKVRNRMNPVLHFLVIPQDSSTRNYLPADEIKADPTLAGKQQDGTVHTGMPNLSNPKAVLMVAEAIKKNLRAHPEQHSAAIAPDDGYPRDWTPETLKLNMGFPDVGGRVGVSTEASVSEEWIDFVNKVIKEVKKEFPNHMIGTNGYANRNVPPQGLDLDPNMYIMFAAIWSDTLHAYDDPKSWQAVRQGQMMKRWAELCKNVYIYNYTYLMLVSGGAPLPITPKIARDMRLMKQWGIIGFSDEGRYVCMESGIQANYLRARMEWDADLDVKALLDRYYRDWYGAAAVPSQAFWTALENAVQDTPLLGHEDRMLPYIYSPALINELHKQINEAKRLADSDRARQHVRADELILEHLEGYLGMTHAEWAADYPGAVKRIDYMMERRKELSQMSPWYTLAEDEKAGSGFYYWGIGPRRKYYQDMADRTTGKTGELIAKLPSDVSFRLDPRDDGRYANWYAPGEINSNGKLVANDTPLKIESGFFRKSTPQWTSVSTLKPFYLQVPGGMDDSGYPYMGALWYHFNVDVPLVARGKRVFLYAPSVETEAWVWVNGKLVGYRPYIDAYVRPNAIDMDITDALKPGQHNTIAVRVHTGFGAAQQAGGFYSRLFLYSPKEVPKP